MPFKMERTEEKITARSGLALYGEFMEAMGVEGLAEKHIPKAGSGRGYKASAYITPISMMLYGGGEGIEDVREIRGDSPIRDMLEIEEVPSSSGIGDWLKRMGERGGIEGMEKVNDEVVRKIFEKDKGDGYTLIIDPTMIEANKREAEMSYLGYKGYRPVIATLKENGVAIAYKFKGGSDNGGKLEIVKKAFSKMPPGKKISTVLLDSEYYSNEVIEYVSGKVSRWAIAADKDAAVMEAIRCIPDEGWAQFKTRDGLTTDREIAETVHTMNKSKKSFRLVVLRWRDKQPDLFGNKYNYHCIAAEMEKESSEELVWEYNGRVHIENHIKEVKGGFGMERMPCGEFGANAVYFGIGILTYNLFLAQRMQTMPEEWKTKTIKSIRWIFVEVGGKLIRHGRETILKIAASVEKYRIYLEMRRRTYELISV